MANKLTGRAKSLKPIKVSAHERLPPVRKPAGKPSTAALQDDDQDVDNAFDKHSAPAFNGLQGEPQVNHLKAAIGLLGRKRV